MRSISLALLATAVLVTGLGAQGRPQAKRVSAALGGENEVPVVISPDAAGSFTAVIDDIAREIRYELKYIGLQSTVAQAHIHVAQPAVNGGIVAWLCETTAVPDPDTTAPTPSCLGTVGSSGAVTVTGTITPAFLKSVPAQGFSPNTSTATPPLPTLTADERFDRFVEAIRSGNAYANIHTAQSPGGEIRGQIETGAGHH